jgi:hypothetical protein
MNRDAPELVEAREVLLDLGGAADPSADAVSRVRSRVLAHHRPSRRLGRPWLATPAVAAAVLAIALVVAMAPWGRHLPTTAGPSPSSRPPSITNPPRIVGPLPLSQAVHEMTAASSQALMLTVPPGQLLYSRFTVATRAGGVWTTTVAQRWSDPNHIIGPTLSDASPQYLATLPADPAALFARFAALNAGVKLGADRYVVKEVTRALRAYGPLLSPNLRAAYYGVLGLVPGASAVRVTLNGQTLYGIRDIASQVVAEYLLCDPSTGQAVGELTGPDEVELWHYAVVRASGQVG